MSCMVHLPKLIGLHCKTPHARTRPPSKKSRTKRDRLALLRRKRKSPRKRRSLPRPLQPATTRQPRPPRQRHQLQLQPNPRSRRLWNLPLPRLLQRLRVRRAQRRIPNRRRLPKRLLNARRLAARLRHLQGSRHQRRRCPSRPNSPLSPRARTCRARGSRAVSKR